MSLISSLVFFPVDLPENPLRPLESVLSEVSPGSSLAVTRTAQLDDSWNEFQRELRGEESEKRETSEGALSRLKVEVAVVSSLFEEGANLFVDVSGKLPWSMQLFSYVRDTMSAALIGDYLPANCDIRLGMHDIWEAIESDEGTLFSRSNFSLRFWGYSSPLNAAGFRREVIGSPIVKEIRCRLEAIVGRVEVCFYLS